MWYRVSSCMTDELLSTPHSLQQPLTVSCSILFAMIYCYFYKTQGTFSHNVSKLSREDKPCLLARPENIPVDLLLTPNGGSTIVQLQSSNTTGRANHFKHLKILKGPNRAHTISYKDRLLKGYWNCTLERRESLQFKLRKERYTRGVVISLMV